MSLQIIKAGLLDTIQDLGRYGYQHQGINPGGAMDKYSAQLANALLGKELNAPVIEMHFPSATILFEKEALICITGADFTATIHGKKIPTDQPVVVAANSTLNFTKRISGARAYLSILQQFDLNKWLNSYTTNLVAAAGGFKGRSLKKGDTINFKNITDHNLPIRKKDFIALRWRSAETVSLNKGIRFIKGNEWEWLSDVAKNTFEKENFKITGNSNRMGYRLEGTTLKVKEEKQLVSSGVTFGTMQLLPDGQLIILMADHQTTGGYPRIGHVISADLPTLAQHGAGDEINFTAVEPSAAEQQIMEQNRHLLQIQNASKFKMEKLLNVTL